MNKKERTELKSIGQNQTELKFIDGSILFFSYSTPVAVFIPGRGALCTTKKYSATTSRHINKAVDRWNTGRVDVDQGEIDEIASNQGGFNNE